MPAIALPCCSPACSTGQAASACASASSALSLSPPACLPALRCAALRYCCACSLGFPGNEALVEDYGMPQLKTALKARNCCCWPACCCLHACRYQQITANVPGYFTPCKNLAYHHPPPALPQALEGVWLRDGPFVAGQRQVSIADLLLSCEVEQLSLLDGAAQVRRAPPLALTNLISWMIARHS